MVLSEQLSMPQMTGGQVDLSKGINIKTRGNLTEGISRMPTKAITTSSEVRRTLFPTFNCAEQSTDQGYELSQGQGTDWDQI